MKEQYSWIPKFCKVIAILATLYFLLLVVIQWFFCFDFHYEYLALAMIPMFLYGLLASYTQKGKLRNIFTSILIVILVPIFLIVGAFGTVFMIFDDGTSSITDLSKYQRTIGKYGYKGNDDSYLFFFPSKLPKDAKKVEFYHLPQFLQGGAYLYLHVVYDNEAFEREKEELKEKAIHVISLEAESEDAILYDNEVDGFYISDDFLDYFDMKVPGKWTYYIYENEKDEEADSWNHGFTTGVAVKESSYEIVYYMKYW